MSDMNSGKASAKFCEKANEWNNIVLTNKSKQTTRFVRSLQRCNTTVLRNLPTLCNVLGDEFHTAALKFDNTKAKEIETAIKSCQRLFNCQKFSKYAPW